MGWDRVVVSAGPDFVSRMRCNASCVAAQNRDPARHGTMRMDGPRLCSASHRTTLRTPGVLRSVRGTRVECSATLSAPLQCSSANLNASAVGWAKAHSAVPTIALHEQQGVGTLRLAHPTESRLWHAARLADTPSRSRGAFRPSFAWSRYPLEPRGRREGRVPAGTRGLLRE